MKEIINIIPSKDISFRTRSLLSQILDRLELTNQDRLDLEKYITFGGGENLDYVKENLEIFTQYKDKILNIIKDAPEEFDTLIEIFNYIESHIIESNKTLEEINTEIKEFPKKEEFATINGKSLFDEENIEIEGGEGTSSGTYESNIEDGSIAMTENYGDFKVGTTVESLKGKTYDELFDGILFPTVNPTFTAPSASIAWSGYAATQEVGATGPTANNFTTGYNAGAITLSGKKQNNRGGAQNTANSFIYVNGNVANRTLPSKVTLGNTTFKYRAAYAQGPQPKNNKGNNYDSPLAAGSVDSGAITLNGTYPWYASTLTAGVLTKQALIAWNATDGAMQAGANGVGFEVQPHTAAAPQKFKLPRKATSLQMYNTVAKAFETVALSDWDETTSQDTINGNTRTYYTYTYKGDARGSVKLIVKF